MLRAFSTLAVLTSTSEDYNDSNSNAQHAPHNPPTNFQNARRCPYPTRTSQAFSPEKSLLQKKQKKTSSSSSITTNSINSIWTIRAYHVGSDIPIKNNPQSLTCVSKETITELAAGSPVNC
jgi:hypothetical protein